MSNAPTAAALQEFLAFANHLADAARPIVHRYFRQDHGVTLKDDATPVTLADRAIEMAWRDAVMETYPTHGIRGEEFGHYQSDAGYQWIFDPIDGTKAFALGRTSFGCLIALHHREQGFLLGVCDQPVTDERWTGLLDQPSTYNGQPLPRRVTPLPDAPFRAAFTNPLRFDPQLKRLHDGLVVRRAVIGYGGDCLNFAGIASGLIDVTVENGQSLHDVAPFVAILRGVGAVITQGNGSPIGLEMGDSVVACATTDLVTAITTY